MTITYISERSEQVTVTAFEVYSASSINSAHVIFALVHNESASPVLFTLNIITNGGTNAVTNQYFKDYISPNESRQLYEILGAVLTNGDSIEIVADTANALNFKLSIKELTT